MLLKGATLDGGGVRPHPGLRPMVDLDLLVDRDHLEEGLPPSPARWATP